MVVLEPHPSQRWLESKLIHFLACLKKKTSTSCRQSPNAVFATSLSRMKSTCVQSAVMHCSARPVRTNLGRKASALSAIRSCLKRNTFVLGRSKTWWNSYRQRKLLAKGFARSIRWNIATIALNVRRVFALTATLICTVVMPNNALARFIWKRNVI